MSLEMVVPYISLRREGFHEWDQIEVNLPSYGLTAHSGKTSRSGTLASCARVVGKTWKGRSIIQRERMIRYY